ncbi:hypothetical protein B7494_g3302 [Chlorociboria aeruginascens]|nr:hypothetical protein B7494_g3302 [Chlorociboria aeruginascens]
MGECRQKEWREIAAEKRASLLSSFPSEWIIPVDCLPSEEVLNVSAFPRDSGFFADEELRITEAGAVEIVENISQKVWTAEHVTTAFCKKAAVAHQLINCLTETLFSEALATARSLDEYFIRTGKLVGPLHGLPISLKDNFETAGRASCVGFVGWADQPATRDSSLVALLKKLGAVVYVKTNVPPAMMMAETTNNVFGRTVNPLNRSLTPGGSSGGEAALLSFGGSPLGVGTDIGGSLRIPAACSGIFTLKPSLGRFPHFDTKSGMAGQEAVVSVNGPMSKNLSDIKLFAKTVIDSTPWLIDPKCLPIPWRNIEAPKKLKIGILWNDGVVNPTPPVKRALAETVLKLRAAGHEVVDWAPEGHIQAPDILAKMFFADGGKTIRNSIETSGEPWQDQMMGYANANEIGVFDMWQIHRERNALCKMYLDRWNACDGLDAILSPTTPYTSVKHGDWLHVGYTCIWNILDYTSVSFPTGLFADEQLDLLASDEASFGELDTEIRAKYLILPYGMSEDCLYLNVVRPSKMEPRKKLPILFWIHGGSYQAGASSLPNYNLTYIVQRSMEMGTPIIAVSVNYRKGPWGLIYGDEIKEEGNENLAIKDVILALRWVKENLGAFGGDAEKVTIQGESSGSFMVGQLIVAGAGKDEQLFHQAIQESGSATTGTYNGTDWYEPQFRGILNLTNCNSLKCLREIPYEQLYPAMNYSLSGAWYPVLDGNLFPEHPAKLLATGQYHKIPIIDGVNTDEGTDNAVLGIDTDFELVEHLITVGNPVMTLENVQILLDLYSYVSYWDPSPYGIPFDTPINPQALGLDLGQQYKRQAAIVGDLYYHGTLLHDAALYSIYATPSSPIFVYRFDTLPWNFTTDSSEVFSQSLPSNASTIPIYTNSYKGVAHFSETPFVFNNPEFYGPDPEYEKLAKKISGFWVSFVNYGDPTPEKRFERDFIWEPYSNTGGDEVSEWNVAGNIIVMRTEERGGIVKGLNDWRLVGREFLVERMKEVYQS